MSASDYVLYTVLFAGILATQLGTRRPDLKRLVLPIVIVAAVGAKYLRALPTGTTSHLLEIAGVAAGLLFGLAAIGFIRVRSDSADGRLVTQASWPYALTWLIALVLRLGFAYGSTHWFSSQLASFSVAHHVTGTAYAAAFVLMVLTMISVRTAGVVYRSHTAHAQIPTGNLRIAQRISR
jgi:hypothetical protein